MTIIIPNLKLPSINRQTGHWSQRSKLRRHIHEIVSAELVARRNQMPVFPCKVTITRCGPRVLDGDNLSGACKPVRDAIAKFSGIDDKEENGWVWECAQQRIATKQFGKFKYHVILRLEQHNASSETARV